MIRTPVMVLALLAVVHTVPPFGEPVSNAQPVALESPRIRTLRAELAQKGDAAIHAFWRDVAQRGAPLVETLVGEERYRLVTFLWRGQQTDTRHVLIVGGVTPRWAYTKDTAQEKLMARLEDTDVWYKTYRVRSDARVAYLLSPNDPFIEDRKSSTWQLDPLNPQRFEYKLDPQNPQSVNVTPEVSLLSLPDAPAQRWTQPREGIARGTLTATTIRSALLGNERRLWVYTPPAYQSSGARYPLLVVFDGWEYLHWIPTPTILDNLFADRLIPPSVAVFVDTVPARGEIACYPPFGSFLTTELLPSLHATYHLTKGPQQTVLVGSSLGGLAAACVALENPTAFGKVLSQSGAFWWSPPSLWPKGNQPAAVAEPPEWTTRRVAALPPAPLQLYLEIGLLETSGNPTMLDANRRVRDALQAKKYKFRYVEFNGRHEFANWRETLGEGLMYLLGPPRF